MSATIRIHRGPSSPDRILLVGRDEVARLTDEITDVTASAGEHVLSTRLGIYHGVATKFRVKEGDVLEFFEIKEVARTGSVAMRRSKKCE